ncbi:MAG: class II fructose-bisphosphate aldolase, partial [Acidimicrobiia bacterium]|nr:class II fructose-bisphosphate aldolase [Acidimicrobiia bacterium]
MTLGVELELLRALHAARRAVVAAVAYDLVTLEAIAAAGEATGCPVIAQVGSSAFGLVHGPALIAAARTVAGAVTAPVGLHLDHSRDLDEIRRCLDAGYTSVMIDGSRLSLGANIELSARAVEVARPYGVWVEAELGHLSGNEDRSVGAVAGQLTEPAEAARFVADTGVDALA